MPQQVSPPVTNPRKEGEKIPRYIESIRMKEVKGYPAAVIRFSETLEVLSDAILNGGISEADAAFIMEVPKDFHCSDYMGYIRDVRDSLGLPENSVGMMTAAEVDHVFNVKTSMFNGTEVTAFATAGLANHVIAGEELKDYDRKSEVSMRRMNALRPGTINIGVVSPVPLTMEGKVNLMIPLVEAKTVAMRMQGFLETGTTSDSMAVFCPKGDDRVNWTGTGTDIGIAAARSVIDAVGWALKARDEHPMPLEPRDALERMGLTEEYLYSSSDKGLSREEFGKRLDEVLSDERVAAALDVAYAVMHRADSMADDGNTDSQRVVKRMLCDAFDAKDIDGDCINDIVLGLLLRRL